MERSYANVEGKQCCKSEYDSSLNNYCDTSTTKLVEIETFCVTCVHKCLNTEDNRMDEYEEVAEGFCLNDIFDCTNNERNTEIIETSYSTSDETFEKLCHPCSEMEKIAESEMYCAQCDEHLCKSCAIYHTKLKSTKGHQLITTRDLNEGNKHGISNPSEPCTKHFGQCIEWLCEDHNNLCCYSCKVTDHRYCNIVSLNKASKGIRENEDFKTTLEKVTLFEERLADIEQRRIQDGENIDAEKNEAVKTLEEFTDKVKCIIDSLKAADLNKIETDSDRYQKSIAGDVTACRQARIELKQLQTVVQNGVYADAYIFIQIEKAKKIVESASTIVSKVSKTVGSEQIGYEPNINVIESIKAFDRLGLLCSEKRMFKVCSSEQISLNRSEIIKQNNHCVCIKTINGKYLLVCCLGGSCISLIEIEENTIIATVKLADEPFDMCCISGQKFAVTLTHAMKVQFIKIHIDREAAIKTITSFDTREKCRGIEYHNSRLYVACGGFNTENEGIGQIRVFNINGELKNTFYVHGNYVLQQPLNVRKSQTSPDIFITDLKLGLLKITKTGNIDALYNDTNIRSVFVMDDNRLLVADKSLKSIDLHDVDGRYLESVVEKNDGMQVPIALTFDKETCRLFVSFHKSDFIKMFQLEQIVWEMPARN